MSFNYLVKLLCTIDSEAADDLETMAQTQPGFIQSYSLDRCFVWSDSPQGFAHWDSVHCKLNESSEYIDFQGYMGLIKRVESIDPAASEYLRLMIHNDDPSLNCSSYLDECFGWGNTPQGFAYWQRINAKLKTISTI